MSLHIVQNQQQIVDSIYGFSQSYHADFFSVRCLARTYLAGPPSLATVNPLSTALTDVLARWGAGRRKAPTLLPIVRLQATLMDGNLQTLLSGIAANSIATMNLANGINRTIGGIHNAAILTSFDANLLNALNELSVGLFSNNTNVTYPMKALLLITGVMPALDSQVRKGLDKGGFVGTNKTQFLLPDSTTSADGMKVSRLPFYIAGCFAQNSALISQTVAASRHPALASEVGRIFDVIFFMQAEMPQHILWLQPPNRDWYNLV